MKRVTIFASTLPLLVAGFVANEQLSASNACLAIGGESLQITSMPWHERTEVSFTSDPAKASVRVQIVDDPESADFAVVEDIGTPDSEACGASGIVRYVSIASRGSGPVIYLSHENADLKIFVRSKSFSEQDAAALIVAGREPMRRTASRL